MKSKTTSKKTSTAALAKSEIEHLEQLLQFMTEHNLEEFEYSRGDVRIRFRKPLPPGAGGFRTLAAPEIIVASSAEAPSSNPQPSSSAAAPASAKSDLHLVKSPIVGTYYESPSPGTDAFVKIGSNVESGQTLCIVEAMKLMNEIESDMAGEVLKIFVENGQPVEYGQPLFGIRPSRKK